MMMNADSRLLCTRFIGQLVQTEGQKTLKNISSRLERVPNVSENNEKTCTTRIESGTN